MDPNPRPPDDDSLLKGENWFSKRLVNLICAITPKCEEVTRILSQGMDRPLPPTTRFKLKIHYLMCTFCKRYEKHLRYLRGAASAFPDHIDDTSTENLPPEAKERLKQVLRDQSRPR